MSDVSLLGPSGTPYVDLSGARAWREFKKGDMVCSLQWLDLQAHDPNFPEDGPIPCMVLHHAFRRLEVGAHVIPQRYAYLYGAREESPPSTSSAASVMPARRSASTRTTRPRSTE